MAQQTDARSVASQTLARWDYHDKAAATEEFMTLVLSLLMRAIIALVIGAYALWRRGGSLKQIALMLLLAVVMAVNVAIWTLPDASGNSPLANLPQQ